MNTGSCPKCDFLNPPDADTCGRRGADIGTAHEVGFFPDTLIAGRFRRVRRIGEGAMGEVWEAEQTTIKRRVGQTTLSKLSTQLIGRHS